MRRVQLRMIVIIFIGSLLSGSCTAAENSNGFIGGKNQKSYVSFEKNEHSMVISESGKSAPIFYSSNDFPGVIRVVKDLQSDISKVTNAEPEIISDGTPSSGEVLIVGTLGKNPLIDKLVSEKKINVDEVKGKWEAYKICTIDNPFSGVSKALVIVGNDKRGSIYGMYDLSEKIGVSPWYWWADVPVKKHDALYINNSTNIVDAPKVKYRGFFINDEAPALSGWSQEKYGTVQFNHKLYVHVFELLLRLKANFLWPAMWGRSFFDDDKMNPVLADEYGVVISTSHHEPMMRAQAEWQRYGSGPWDYEKNADTLRAFWKKGIENMDSHESIITLAMRGDGDMAMSPNANVALLQKIVEDQRKIIAEVTKKDVTKIPQVWALYKEVQEYYDKGMRVPDDVTLLLCDDNWGNLRRLPALNAKPRTGGYGIYYHFDYVGGPRNYKWLNTVQISRVYEQMHLAYEYGARQIWIVNVGDIKPEEYPISFFLDYAWNPDNFSAQDIPDYSVKWAEEQFGKKYSKEIGEMLEEYTRYNSRRKPELLSPGTYSLTNYREAETVVKDYNNLAERAEKIYNNLPEESKDAYYQLVLYPIKACANLNDLYVTAAKNNLYAAQGRVETNELAEKVKKLFETDAELSAYYNKVMSGGKWDHMMDQTHIGYTYWQEPKENNMPKVETIKIPETADMGVMVEGSANWWPDSKEKAALPAFDPLNNQKYYIEIFNRGSESFNYSVKTGNDCITINEPEGKIKTQNRIFVSIDWTKAPMGKQEMPITISGPNGNNVVVNAVVDNSSNNKNVKGFVENNGCISIEAQHYSKAVGGSEIKWVTVPDLGRTLSGVTPFPVTAAAQTPEGNNPHLEYNVDLQNTGSIKVNVYLSPTLNFTNSEHGIRYAVSIDDEKPQIVNMTSNQNPPDLNRDRVWNGWVANNINIQTTTHNIDKPGHHTLKIWMVDPGIVVQKIVIDAGGEKPSYLGPPESIEK